MYNVPLLKITFIVFLSAVVVSFVLLGFGVITTENLPEIMVVSIGFLPILVSLYLLYIIYIHTKWEKNKALVVDINIVCQATEVGDKFMRHCYDVPVINYIYTVDEKKYESSRLGVFKNDYGHGWGEDVDKFINKNFSEKNIAVWFNPENPSESILLQGCSKKKLTTIIGYFLVGLIIIAWGSYILYFKI